MCPAPNALTFLLQAAVVPGTMWRKSYREAMPADYPLLGSLNHQLIRDEGHRNPMNVLGVTGGRIARWIGSGDTQRSYSRRRRAGGFTRFTVSSPRRSTCGTCSCAQPAAAGGGSPRDAAFAPRGDLAARPAG